MSLRTKPSVSDSTIDVRQEALLNRARRFRRRGEHRRAMLAFEQACFLSEEDARLWTLYAIECKRAGRPDSAREALTRAVWLRQRQRDTARVRATRRLLERLRDGDAGPPLEAA